MVADVNRHSLFKGRQRAQKKKTRRVAAGPESAGVLGVGEGEVAADAEAEVDADGGARLSCVGLCGPSPFTAPGSDTRFMASICSLFSPILLFA